MTVVAVGPEDVPVQAPRPTVDPGLLCEMCGAATDSANAYERRCPDCGRTFKKPTGRGYRAGSRIERMAKAKAG